MASVTSQASSGLNQGTADGPSKPLGLLAANSQSFSDIPMDKFSHLWTIRNFNLIPVDMERLCSPWFSPPNSKDLWFLKLRLKAFDENNGNQEFIGVHLFLKECADKRTKEVRAHYTISVLDSLGNKRFTGECSKPEGRIFKAGTEGHGYKLLCPRDGIFRPENKLLGEDNSLNIRCEVTVFGEVKHTPPRNQGPVFTSEQLTQNCLAVDLGHFLKKDSGKDTILVAKGGVRIPVHRAILMARSDVFQAMFEHETKEKLSNEVFLNDIDVETLEKMIHFMYTDDVPKINTHVDELLMVADRYNLTKLKLLCEEHLIPLIDGLNAAKYLSAADMANATALKKHCLEFVSQNPHEVTQTPDWNSSMSKRPLLYKEAFEILAKKSRSK